MSIVYCNWAIKRGRKLQLVFWNSFFFFKKICARRSLILVERRRSGPLDDRQGRGDSLPNELKFKQGPIYVKLLMTYIHYEIPITRSAKGTYIGWIIATITNYFVVYTLRFVFKKNNIHRSCHHCIDIEYSLFYTSLSRIRDSWYFNLY